MTTSCYELHIDLTQRLFEDSLCGVSRSPREIETDVEEDYTSSIYYRGLVDRRHPTFHF